MWIKRWAAFKKETERRYREGIASQMEPWKKKVMVLHEISSFLFYFEEIKEWDEDSMQCRIYGDLVKGSLPLHETLYLYNGEGKCLGKAILLSTPEEKEEKRIGVFREKKNECDIQLLSAPEDDGELRGRIQRLAMDLSLISDQSPESLLTGN